MAFAQAGHFLLRIGIVDEVDEQYLECVARFSPEVFEEDSPAQKLFRATIRALLLKGSEKPESD